MILIPIGLIYSYSVACLLNDVAPYLKALGHDFIQQGLHNLASLLFSPLVMSARQHGDRGQARQIAKARDKNLKSPVSGEILRSLYDVEWTMALSSVDVNVIGMGIGCLIGWCMTQFGLRISNLAKTESDSAQVKGTVVPPVGISLENRDNVLAILDRHALRAEDVLVQIEGRSVYVNAYLFVKEAIVGNVDNLVVSIVTSKSNQKAARVVKVKLSNTSFGEKRLLDMLVVYMRFAQYDSPTDMFFSRAHVNRISGTSSNTRFREKTFSTRYC